MERKGLDYLDAMSVGEQKEAKPQGLSGRLVLLILILFWSWRLTTPVILGLTSVHHDFSCSSPSVPPIRWFASFFYADSDWRHRRSLVLSTRIHNNRGDKDSVLSWQNCLSLCYIYLFVTYEDASRWRMCIIGTNTAWESSRKVHFCVIFRSHAVRHQLPRDKWRFDWQVDVLYFPSLVYTQFIWWHWS